MAGARLVGVDRATETGASASRPVRGVGRRLGAASLRLPGAWEISDATGVGAVQLELTDAEATLLRELLDQTCRDLSYEIADTDNSTYRAGLRDRRDAMRKMLDAVGGPVAD
jgi:hypothetical protein